MPAKAYAGRVGRLAVALGIGAAIVTGWSSGLAWADEFGGSTGTAASSTGSDTEPATANASAAGADTNSPVTKDDEERSQDAPASTTETSPSETAAPPGTDADEGPTSKPATKNGSDPAAGKLPKTKTPAPVSTVADTKHDERVAATPTHTETTEDVSLNPWTVGL